jgi:hypothetical protein
VTSRANRDALQVVLRFTAPRAAVRWALFKREASSGGLEDYRYTSVRDYGLPLVRATVERLHGFLTLPVALLAIGKLRFLA